MMREHSIKAKATDTPSTLHTSIPELPVRKESSHSRSLQQLQVVQQLQRTQHSKQPGG